MKATILLVEDNTESRYLFSFILKRTGADVVQAGNGVEALKALETCLPDLIIMDIQMPEMDGYEAVGRLRQNPRLAKTPVVGLSAYAMTSDREKALNSGFNGYIEKPIEIEHFLRELSVFLPGLDSK